MRKTEYGKLDEQGQVFLNYTGSNLCSQSQMNAFHDLLAYGPLPTSPDMGKLEEKARAYVLKFFNADPESYDVIFTANASEALRIVGDTFAFSEGSRYLLIADNHNSVNGIREFAKAKGATVTYNRPKLPDLRIDPEELSAELASLDANVMNLFAFPAQSNYTGVKHDLAWIEKAKSLGWHVLLDAAAFVPTNVLDLSRVKPDFVPMSFYKIFGYPTGIGALLVNKSIMHQMKQTKSYFSGHNISISTTLGDGQRYLLENHEAYEDGTKNFLNIPMVKIGLKHIERIGQDVITTRVYCLTGWLLQQMQLIKHMNETPLVIIKGPKTMENHGCTIAFSLQDPEGKQYDFRIVQQMANAEKISLRTGHFCNPGSVETAHGITQEEIEQVFNSDHVVQFGEFADMAAERWNKFPGSIRISTGLATNFSDVYFFISYLESFLNKPASEVNSTKFEQQEKQKLPKFEIIEKTQVKKIVAAREIITQNLTIKNISSQRSIPSGFKLVQVSGASTDVSMSSLSEVPPGVTADFAIKLFASNEVGRHRQAWRLTTPEGQVFGPWITANYQVLDLSDVDEEHREKAAGLVRMGLPLEKVSATLMQVSGDLGLALSMLTSNP